ncbi:MAG: STAS domain-containing protein [Comamonadaceae bacterium]|nr:STAS domain-containing protein [Comamonadaceae bacterium]
MAPLAAYLPNAAMAGILFLVAWGLIDFHHIAVIARASRSEAAVLAVTFGATLVMHLEFAILVGIVLSLMLYLNRTSRPHHPLAGAGRGRSASVHFVERRAGQPECPQLKIVRIEGSLYFGAVNHVGEYFHDIAERQPQKKHLLLMSRSINFVDVAGAELLAQEARSRRARGGRLYLHSLREAACRMLCKPPYADDIGADALFTEEAPGHRHHLRAPRSGNLRHLQGARLRGMRHTAAAGCGPSGTNHASPRAGTGLPMTCGRKTCHARTRGIPLAYPPT